MNYIINALFIFSISLNLCGCQETNGSGKNLLPEAGVSPVELWLTTNDESILFEKQDSILNFLEAKNSHPTIKVDPEVTYQSIDGFGYTLTGGSAMHIYRMGDEERRALLINLFATDSNHIGTSYVRLSIGASDLDEATFSYNDLPAGETDYNME